MVEVTVVVKLAVEEILPVGLMVNEPVVEGVLE